MNRLRSGPLAAWTCSWLAGVAASDEVIRAVTGDDATHTVEGLADGGTAPLSEALISWRRAGHQARLILPVPGDVRGVPGPAPFRDAALDAGEAVYAGPLGLVPTVIERSPSSAPPAVIWHAFAVARAPDDYLAVTDAQYELTSAIRECASAISAAQVSAWIEGIDADLASARRAGERLNLPPGHPPAAVSLLAQAERLQAVLDLAARDPFGSAIDRPGMGVRTQALYLLATAVRRARLASYNAASD
ncbi:MAG: hypothetical protein M3O28_06510 [Actinomycetota bacterium]|nr:hypothetical protein [Actinomycetota bacterium]